MKCWRCEKDIEEGTRECLYCHASQRRTEPVTDPGQALRQLYDRYGAKQALTDPVLLVNGLGAPGHTNDWYGFAQWGIERMPIVFAVMVVVVWLIACGLRAANQRVYRMRAL